MANELILIVEDNEKNRKLMRDVLTFKGYRHGETDLRHGPAPVRRRIFRPLRRAARDLVPPAAYRSAMDRRRFLLTSLAGVVVAPIAAEAQQPGKVYRIGYLAPSSPSDPE